MQHQSLQEAPVTPGTSGTPGPTVLMILDNDKKETTFAKKTATGLSIVQIISGIASFISQIAIIILVTTDSRNYYSYIDFAGGIGEGIYCGVFFIIAGGLGLLASRKPTICNMSAFMTLSIIASIMSGIQIILASIKLGIIDNRLQDGPGWRRSLSEREAKMAMLSIMILAGVVEMIVAIVCAAICCGACCCSGNGPSAGRVVYLAQGENAEGATTGGVPVQMAGGVPVQMTGGVPVQMAGGVPMQMAYLPKTEVMDQTLNELPTYGDVVKGDKEETKQKSESGGYMRF